ncbi:hypothetical protein GCK72_018002 [Caenorhabditis remanei]|uniref:Uncharacterized protein n=1 Tax=Caenorhabditis remanei TaxID=31234 RepID=A0A6A5G8N2_CAERE|nr:hypothetical protein GCK72_018002 [Caenorhabditis remanei]KAF1751448.1 hypothetical protein GCK72_018002 [Caenorhabditis remanei]
MPFPPQENQPSLSNTTLDRIEFSKKPLESAAQKCRQPSSFSLPAVSHDVLKRANLLIMNGKRLKDTSCLLNMGDANQSCRNSHVPLSSKQEKDYTSLVNQLDDVVNNMKQFHDFWIFDKVCLTLAVAASAYISFFSPLCSPQAIVAIAIYSFLVMTFYTTFKFAKWINNSFHFWMLLKETQLLITGDECILDNSRMKELREQVLAITKRYKALNFSRLYNGWAYYCLLNLAALYLKKYKRTGQSSEQYDLNMVVSASFVVFLLGLVVQSTYLFTLIWLAIKQDKYSQRYGSTELQQV